MMLFIIDLYTALLQHGLIPLFISNNSISHALREIKKKWNKKDNQEKTLIDVHSLLKECSKSHEKIEMVWK